jgi:hypothetical protein
MKKINKIKIVCNSSPTSEQDKYFDGETLEFCLSAMIGKEYKNLSLDNFLSREEFSKSADPMQKDLLVLLDRCDQILIKNGLDAAFKHTAFWFSHRLSNLMTIKILANNLEESFDEIKIFISGESNNISEEKCSLSSLRLENINPSSLKDALKFLNYMIPKSRIINTKDDYSFFYLKIKRYLEAFMSLHKIIFRRVNLYLLRSYRSYKTKGTNKVWILESGWDTDVLYNHYPNDLSYKLDIFEEIKHRLVPSNLDQNSLNDITEEIDRFSKTHFPELTDLLNSFFLSYLSEIGLFASKIKEELIKIFQIGKVDSIIFSSGASDMFEKIASIAASELNIKVFWMRHQGIELSFLKDTYFDKFTDKDEEIKRTQFILNENELSFFPKENLVNYHINELIELSKVDHKDISSKKILYSVGQSGYQGWKNFRDEITDRERKLFSEKLSSTCKKNKLIVDFKLHPASLQDQVFFYRNLSFNSHSKVLTYESVNRLMGKYGIIVFDMIASRALTYALYHDFEIILYVPNQLPVRTENFQDLESRVHIVRNVLELEKKLDLFSQNKLKHKTSNIKFNEKYFGHLSYEDSIEKAFQRIIG